MLLGSSDSLQVKVYILCSSTAVPVVVIRTEMVGAGGKASTLKEVEHYNILVTYDSR